MSFDLTNKNIQDTFQNLLQKTGSEGHLYDLVGNQIDNLTIGGTLTAHSYVTSESIVNTSSGSTAFGNSSDDTHKFTGNITASGNISSSGDFIGTTYKSHKFTGPDFLGQTIQIVGDNGTKHITKTPDILLKGNVETTSHITASGNISSSGTITAEQLTTTDDLNVGDDLIIEGAGGAVLFEGGVGATVGSLTYNDNGMKLNTGANNPASTTHLFVSSSGGIASANTRVGIGIPGATPTVPKMLTVAGDISASSATYTAQLYVGDIRVRENPTDNLNIAGTKSLHVSNHITASGNISASGGISASGARFNNEVVINKLVGNDDVLLNVMDNGTPRFQVLGDGDLTAQGDITLNNSKAFYVKDSGGTARKIGGLSSETITLGSGGFLTRIAASSIELGTQSPIGTVVPVTGSIISASGEITADVMTPTTITNVNTTHITASGNISASGDQNVIPRIFGPNVAGMLDSPNEIAMMTDNRIDLAPAGMIVVRLADSLVTLNQDTLVNGHITASENISASGNIYGNQYYVKGANLANYTSDSVILSHAGQLTELRGTKITLNGTGNDNALIVHGGHITASGNISSSGTITAEQLTTTDDLSVGDNLEFNSADAKIYDSDGVERISFPNGKTYFNENAANMDFQVETEGQTTLHVDGEADAVVIGGTTVPSGMEFTVNGDISASGTVFADNFVSTGGDDEITFNDNLYVNGHITASGNISASGTSHIFGGTINMDDNKGIENPGRASLKAGSRLTFFGGNSSAGFINFLSGSTNTTVMAIDASSARGKVTIGEGAIGSDAVSRLTVIGDLKTSTHITASGVISASGGFVGSLTGQPSSISNLIASDGANRLLTSDGDGTLTAEANLTFNGSTLTSAAQGNEFQGIMEVNSGNSDNTAFSVAGENDSAILMVSPQEFTDKVGIGTGNPTKKLQVTGDISSSGFIFLQETGSSFQGVDGTGAGYLFASSSGQLCYQSGSTELSVISLGTGTGGGGGSGDMNDVVDDTSPQLGGDLDLNSNDITGTGNIGITGHITASGDISSSGTIIGKINVIDTSTNDDFYPRFGLGSSAQELNVTNGWSFNPSTDTTTYGGGTLVLAGQAGNITASGAISASGHLYGKNFYSMNKQVLAYSEALDMFGISATDIGTTNLNGKSIKINGNITASGAITADGNISSSGNIYLPVNKKIYWNSPDTGDYIGGNGISQFDIRVNSEQAAVFREAKVGIPGYHDGDEKLNVQGIVSASSFVSHTHITASENISASGYISASTFVGDGSGLTGLSSAAISSVANFGDNNRVITAAGAAAVNAESNLTFDGSTLTVDGEITSSGGVYINSPPHAVGAQSINYGTDPEITGSLTPALGKGYGDIIKWGSETTTAGLVYVLASNGNFGTLADKDAIGTTTPLAAVAMGDNNNKGMLLKGFAQVSQSGQLTLGAPVYIGDDGIVTGSVANFANGDFARVIGYCLDRGNTNGSASIYFNPDNTWVEITA